jgi:hypothetical protein
MGGTVLTRYCLSCLHETQQQHQAPVADTLGDCTPRAGAAEDLSCNVLGVHAMSCAPATTGVHLEVSYA